MEDQAKHADRKLAFAESVAFCIAGALFLSSEPVLSLVLLLAAVSSPYVTHDNAVEPAQLAWILGAKSVAAVLFLILAVRSRALPRQVPILAAIVTGTIAVGFVALRLSGRILLDSEYGP